MALTINEKWIRERVHLNPENLDEVRSLALPGTYHEKITHLGSSLQNFSRLKHLDLSRNALQSLDGLQHLVVLEKLNIYYNNIATLKDLYQLRHNTNLQEVDLRLNPVTKNEPDYRLFMVHMLPSLRKLDDRSVRESERKAALMHFNSNQASDLTEHLPMKGHAESDRPTNPRVEMVSNLPRKPTVLDEDDCDVLDLISRSGGDLGRPREITGSTATVSKVTAHSLQDEQRPTSLDTVEPVSTKYPPSPPQADSRPWRGNTWTMEEGPTQRRDDGAQGTVESDNRTLTPTFYSSIPNPKDYPNSTCSPPTPPTPDNSIPRLLPGVLTPNSSPEIGMSPVIHRYHPPTPPTPDNSIPRLLPGVLTPNSSPEIGMSPVFHLYHNMSALKNTVIQSYLNEHIANTSQLNALTVPAAAKRSPDKLTTPQRPFNMRRQTDYSDSEIQARGRRDATSRKTLSNRPVNHNNLSGVAAAVVSPNSDLTKCSPGRAVTPPRALHTTSIGKTSHSNWHPSSYSNNVINQKHSQRLGSPQTSGNSGSGLGRNSLRGTDLTTDSWSSDSGSYLWDYGIPLHNSHRKTNTEIVHGSDNKSVSSSFTKSPQRDIPSHHLTTSPFTLVSPPPPPQANPRHHNSIIKTTPDSHPSHKLNSKSVSFLISSSPDRDDPSPGLKGLPYPLAPHVRVSLNNNQRPPVLHPDLKPNCDSKRVCAIIKPTPEPKGSPTQPAGSQPPTTHKERARVQFSDEALGPPSTAPENRDSNMKYIDESQAYTTYTSKGHFTPRPDANHNGVEPTSSRGSHLDQDAHLHSNRATEPQVQRVSAVPPVTTDKSAAPLGEKVDLNLFLDNFLSLVDRYWNGTKSLHRHGKFQTQAHTLMSTLMTEATASASQPQRQDVSRESEAEMAKLRQALQASQDQVENLRNQLDAALADREQLQADLEAVQMERLPSDRSVGSQQTDRGVRSGVLERDVEKLSRENEGLKLHVKHFSQLQELATMLQESHKSLVITNDHLLQELDETKQRHLEEVKQLHWSYGELKRTMDLAPNTEGSRQFRPNSGM